MKHPLTNRIRRMVDFFKSPPTTKYKGNLCCAKYCQTYQLRETPNGVFCELHYVDGQECKTEGCYHPSVEIGLCYACLNAEHPEAVRFVPRNQSPIAEMQTWAPEYKHGAMNLQPDLDRAIEKHNIKGIKPKEGWFYPPREISEI